MDRFGKAEFVNTGLEATLKEILNLKGKHIIELHTRLVKDTNTDQTANQSIAFEETLRVLLIEGEQLTAKTLAIITRETPTARVTQQ